MSARRRDAHAETGTPSTPVTTPGSLPAAPRAVHIGLWVAWLLSLASVIAQGLGRFAYSLLLPPMREDLSWTYAVAGAMNTSNSVGYLLGALVAAWLGRGQRCKPVMMASLLVAVAAIGGCALTASVPVLLVLRFVTGAAGAIGFVLAAGLLATSSKKAAPERASVMLGIYFAGGCVGIVFVGLLLPLAVPDPSQWRTAWVVLGIAGLACVAAMFPALRVADPEPPRPAGDRRFPRAAIQKLLISYLLFGAGYIAYMTFVVALLRADGASSTTVSVFWSLLGLCGVGAAFFWGPLIGRLPHARGMAFLMVLCAVGALVPVAVGGTVAAMVSAVLFGGTFVSVITAVTVSARASLPSRYWTAAIGTLTVTFSVGQSMGPVLTGMLADTEGGLRLGLGLSAVLLAIGAGVAVLHRNPEQRHDQAHA